MGRNWFDSGYDSLQDGYVGGRKVEVVGHEQGGANHYSYVDERTGETYDSPHTVTPTAAHQQQRHYQRSTYSTRMRSAQNVDHHATRRTSEVEDLKAQAAKGDYYERQQEYHRAAANHARAYLAKDETGYGQMDRRVCNASTHSHSSFDSKGKGIASDVGYLRAKTHAATAPKAPADHSAVANKRSSAADVSRPLPPASTGQGQPLVRALTEAPARRMTRSTSQRHPLMEPEWIRLAHQMCDHTFRVAHREAVDDPEDHRPYDDPVWLQGSQQVWEEKFWGAYRQVVEKFPLVRLPDPKDEYGRRRSSK